VTEKWKMGGEERGHDLGESEGKDCNGDFLPDSLENITLKGRSHTRSALLRERVAQCISTVELTHTLRCCQRLSTVSAKSNALFSSYQRTQHWRI